MTKTILQNLDDANLELPPCPPPAANYAPTVQSGNLLFVSGQLAIKANGEMKRGRLGETMSIEDGQEAARLCALNILTQANAALGGLESIVKLVKVTGFVASAANFFEQPKVINGASDLFIIALAERGQHARAAVGVTTLPLGSAVEVEAIFEVA